MYDYVIIGGGIVGLSTALALIQKNAGASIMVIEKEQELSAHQTGRNSGVIHSGVYYKPGSLKARMAMQGRNSMVEFCQTHDVPHEVCGKVLVATEQEEVPRLEALYNRVQENGLNVTRIGREELQEIEPYANGIEGLRVPSTGIVNYKKVSVKIAELLRQAGVEFSFGSAVETIEEGAGEVTIETKECTLKSRFLINCAGLHSDRLVRMAGIHTDLQIVPFRGEYFKLTEEKNYLVKGLIYPIPNPAFPFLGVHLTKMMDGGIHAGPNAVLSFKREGYRKTDFHWKDAFDVLSFPGFWKMARVNMKEGMKEMVRSFHKESFVKSLQRLVPDIQEEDVIPTDAGVRAQAMLKDGRLVDDFHIITGKRSVHVCNAPSPAATASFEIGREIAERIPQVERVQMS
ncbi:L-2-hydroxyglutarate oxidase [Halobacillus alkaliphilus]|uniref:L-2-hydroxyglutarate oxidase n=1 Tax=Halobacillus alkaliphilus TaxID=396056 RepID=A0A1I2PXN6_9BACI|nr:L-2-hydroxyglutarate oxidase [Halobacillus alkaliphilus]SFG20902.1 L-2-hydroxyglutarate oxidase [Halobacillus alkaliphilus]